MELKEQVLITRIFLKVFVAIEISLLLFCGMGGTWLISYYHQNNYDYMKHEARSFGRLAKIFIEQDIKIKKFDKKVISSKIAKIVKELPKVKTMFVLNKKNIIIAHLDKSFIGQDIAYIYPNLPIKDTMLSEEVGILKDRINQIFTKNIKFEYTSFYQYIIKDVMKHPFYIKNTFTIEGTNHHSASKRYLYIIWEPPFLFFFSGIDALFVFFIISYISFFLALICDNYFKKKLRAISKSTNLEKNKSSQQYKLTPKEKQTLSPKEERQNKNEVNEKIKTPQININQKEEIPEAIVLD